MNRVESLDLKFVVFWQTLGWLWIGTVVILTLMPQSAADVWAISDKLVHFLVYGFLMLWFQQVFSRHWGWMIFLVGLGIILEYLQGWMGHRQFEYRDMIANICGIIGGKLAAYTALGRLIRWGDNRLFQLSQWFRYRK